MSAHHFDAGPLGWVKGEIDAAFAHAAEAVRAFATDQANPAPLHEARTHLHQAHGALAIVGLQGVTEVAAALEGMVAHCVEARPSPPKEALATFDLAIRQLGLYLDEISRGLPHKPLRLWPLYQRVATLGGRTDVSPVDLFYPDLQAALPSRLSPPPAHSVDSLAQLVRIERGRFERGLLAWLKDPAHKAGLPDMREAVSAIELSQMLPNGRAFWWAGTALFDALLSGALQPDLTIKRLCGNINQQLRRLLDGSRTVPERLMREVLYQVAIAQPDGPHVEMVRTVYHLGDHLAAPEECLLEEPEDPGIEVLLASLLNAEEAWHGHCSGDENRLPDFTRGMSELLERSRDRLQPDLVALLERVSDIGSTLGADPARLTEALAMETATALLVVENALQNYAQFQQSEVAPKQVRFALHRLQALSQGQTLEEVEARQRDDVSRRAQEKLATSQVVKEMQHNLAEIEEVLDGFFRDPARRPELQELEASCYQVQGALSMLGQSDAADVMRQCTATIKGLALSNAAPSQAEVTTLTQQLTSLGFYLESLLHGKADFAEASSPVSARPQVVFETVIEPHPDHVPESVGNAEPPADAGRQEPESSQMDDPLAALRAGLAGLSTTQADAEPIPVEKVVEATRLVAADDAADVIDIHLDDVEIIRPAEDDVGEASAATMQETVDGDMLPIFLEEGHDILSTISGYLHALRGRPDDREALLQVRRGFHTLKGSSRMVGLKSFGEGAWTVEQALNLWLQTGRPGTPALLHLAGEAHDLLSSWLGQIAQGGETRLDTTAIDALAAAVSEGVAQDDIEDVVFETIPSPGAGATQAPAPVDLPTPSVDGTLAVQLPVGTDVPDATSTAAQESAIASMVEADEAVAPQAPTVSAAKPTSEAEPSSPPHAHGETAADSATVAPAAEDAVRIAHLLVPARLHALFVNEARAHVATLQQAMEHLDTAGTAADGKAAPAAHTLSGIAATVGFEAIRSLSLALEGALDRVAATPRTTKALATLRLACDGLGTMVAVVKAGALPETDAGLLLALNEVRPDDTQVSTVIPAPTEEVPELDESQVVPSETLAAAVTAAHAGEVAAVPAEAAAIDPELLPIFLEEAGELVRDIGNELRAWKAAPQSPAPPKTLARLLHTLKGSARTAGAVKIGAQVHLIEAKIDARSPTSVPETLAFVDVLERGFDKIALAIDALAPATPSATGSRTGAREGDTPEPREAESTQALRVRTELVDRLVNEAGELSIARARIEGELRTLKISLGELTENVARLRHHLREVEIQSETQMASRLAQAEAQHAEFDPLEKDRFTRLQELTRMLAESVNDVATVQHNLVRNLHASEAAIAAQSRINRELSQGLMSMRMLPLAEVADRLHRTVRQVAGEVGRVVDLAIDGSDVELDRGVLERMTAPLEHLLRNAISHGIEDSATRLQAGKPAAGRVTLSAVQEANEIALTLSDDGRGLDFDRIRARAVALGLMAPDETASESRLTEFIFQPGFSTAEAVSEVAGRGVGMDVVKTEVAALGGRIDVSSQPGHGIRFRIYLPLTLAVTRALLVKLGAKTYAIPSVMVEQVQELKADQMALVRGNGGSEWLGTRFPFAALAGLMGEPETPGAALSRHWLLLLRSGENRLALQVDEISGNEEIVVKHLGPQLSRVLGFSGATVLADGEIVLILNPAALLARSRSLAGAPVVTIPAPRPSARRPSVMVVDDSLTVRKITGRLLEREGYQVLTAKDGVDALEKMTEQVPDVLLVDIEMPRMDGFELTRTVRGEDRLRHIPIIMITSRLADKHRAYAAEIGVNYYLGKPYQDKELLERIGSFVSRPREATPA